MLVMAPWHSRSPVDAQHIARLAVVMMLERRYGSRRLCEAHYDDDERQTIMQLTLVCYRDAGDAMSNARHIILWSVAS